jgi:hypothetical protein
MSYTSTYRYESSSDNPEGSSFLEARLRLWNDTSPRDREIVRRNLKKTEIDAYLKENGFSVIKPNHILNGNEYYKFLDPGHYPGKRVNLTLTWLPVFGRVLLSLDLRAVCEGRKEASEIIDLQRFYEHLRRTKMEAGK